MKYLDLDGLTTFWENAYQKIDDLITTKILECGDFDSSGTYPNLTAGKATKLATARTISLSGGASGSVSFDGSANRDFFVSNLKEAYLSHGGKHITGSYSMLDGMATVEGWNNRLSFWPPELIQVEYTNNYTEDADGNENADVIWSDYFADFSAKDTNSIKTGLVTNGLTNSWLYTTGKSSIAAIANQSRLRITFDIPPNNKYFVVRKSLILVSQGSVSYNDYVIVEKVTRTDYKNGDVDKWTYVTECKLAGDSGWNSLSMDVGSWGITDYSNIYRLRFTIVNGTSRSRKLTLGKIYAIGNTVYALDDNLAKTGHLYSFDWQQNATFPAQVTATKHITQDGTSNQVVLGDGSLKALSEISGSVTSEGIIEALGYTPADAEYVGNIERNVTSLSTTLDTKASKDVATTSANGLMSSTDKTKLDNIPSTDICSNIVEAVANGDDVELFYDMQYRSSDGTYSESKNESIIFPLATSSSAGMMSAADKAKLDNTYTKEEVDTKIGDINTILESIING